MGENRENMQRLVEAVLDNRGRNAERILENCKEIISYAQKNDDQSLLGFAYYYMGETYYCLNDGTRFFDAVSKALTYLSNAGEWEHLARCYNFLGIWAMNRGNTLIAQDYYLKGIEYCRRYDLGRMEIQLGINTAALYVQCGRYEESQAYLERFLEVSESLARDREYHSIMGAVYQNLIKCLIPQGKKVRAEEVLRRLYFDHWDMLRDYEKLTVMCTEAIFYDHTGEHDKCDRCIAHIREQMSTEVAILDTFDDYYDYAVMLLESGRDEAFWQLIDIMEPLVRSCGIVKMQLRLTALKIRSFRKHKQNSEYMQETGLYYELSELMENETRSMMVNVLNLRRRLDQANRAKHEMEKENRILQEKSEMDALTKLANRFRLRDVSKAIIQRAVQEDSSITVEILDVDYFKMLNDHYGHHAGDQCLVRLGEVLKQVTDKHNGFCSRYGGDEFVLIFEHAGKEEAAQYAAELKEKVQALRMENGFSSAGEIVTISQGLCWGKPQSNSHLPEFLHRADELLYEVKLAGRNNYCVGALADADDFAVGDSSEAQLFFYI